MTYIEKRYIFKIDNGKAKNNRNNCNIHNKIGKERKKYKDNIRKIDVTVFLLLKSKEALNYEEIRKCYFND